MCVVLYNTQPGLYTLDTGTLEPSIHFVVLLTQVDRYLCVCVCVIYIMTSEDHPLSIT